MRYYISVFLFLFFFTAIYAQNVNDSVVTELEDISILQSEITTETASEYLQGLMDNDELWRHEGEELKSMIERLLWQYHEPYDSVRMKLVGVNFDSVRIEEKDFVSYDSLDIQWLNDSTFVLLKELKNIEPIAVRTRIVKTDTAPTSDFGPDSLLNIHLYPDSMFVQIDTLIEYYIDSLLLDSMEVGLYNSKQDSIDPWPFERRSRSALNLTTDSLQLVFSDTTSALVANEGSPFFIVPNASLPDSLKLAVAKLLSHNYLRDSIMINLTDINEGKTPLWLSARQKDLQRYWVKNGKNDSITVWLGNPAKNDLSIYLEDDVNINRMKKVFIDEVPIIREEPDLALMDIKPLTEIPVYWEYDLATNFMFSQTMITYWSKGGESALSTMLDIKGEAGYTDKKAKTKWINSARLKYGSIITKDNGMRTNTDMFEINSQYTKLIDGKFDFSASFYMKNQIAKGMKYTEDTAIVISRFLSPSTFTIGLGVEYKPFKNTQINFSPLSYKNTFVLDDSIDVTLHGIEAGKKVHQEMGTQLLITNKMNILEGLEIANTLRLFSNYFDDPQNVDVDWELNLKKRINWYFTVSANIHLIYDDNILFPRYDDDGKEKTWPDGSAMKGPKLQFREFMGLSFSFNF